jgi:acetyltransferase-like isoleucine patch superfamily enzyme
VTGARTIGECRIGTGTLAAEGVVIGHPSKATLPAKRDFNAGRGATVGERCILRSGTVVYEDAVLGDDCQTAHNVVIREGARIGNGCVFGNGSVVREGARLGSNVRMMESVVVAEGAEIASDVLIGPGVVMTAGRYMTGALEASGQMTRKDAEQMEGEYWKGSSVVIESGARIGSHAVLLAGVRLGANCVVAAGAVVSTDVPADGMVVGNPARLMKAPKAGGA